jgi:exosome complex component RRP41
VSRERKEEKEKKKERFLESGQKKMMSILSYDGLRADGRRPHELRRMACRLGLFQRADGSGYWEQGNTKVLAAVYGPREATKREHLLHDRASLICEYQVATFSGGERRIASKQDRRSTEVANFIKQTFESVLLLDMFPGSQIQLYITVLQADGGRRAAAINAATLAFIDAGIPMRELIAACSVGFLESTPMLDMNQYEEFAGGPIIPFVSAPKQNQIVSMQIDNKVPLQHLSAIVDAATQGASTVYQSIVTALRDHHVKNQPILS